MPWNLIIPAALGVAGLFANKGGGGSSGPSSVSAQQQGISDLLGSTEGSANQQFKFGKQDRKAFRGALDPVSAWLQSILGGDRTAIMGALGPEIKQTNQQYDAVSRAISEFAPRGGGRTAGLANLEYKKAGDISDLFSNARMKAASGLQNVAGLYSSQSQGEVGAGAGLLGNALSGALGLRGQDLQKMLADKQNSLALGQSLGRLLSQVLGQFGGGKDGGGTLTSGSGVDVNFGDGDLFDFSKWGGGL